MLRPEKNKKATPTAGKILAAVVLFCIGIDVLEGILLAVLGGGMAYALLTLVLLACLGLGIGVLAAKLGGGRKAFTELRQKTLAAEEKLRSGTQKATRQAKERPEIKFFRGEEVAEDDFALPSADRGKRRLAQLESFYRAGLYTREEYLAEREKAKQRYHM